MLTPMPESPDAAKYTTPGVVKNLSQLVSCATSGSPQLMLTTPPPFSATNFAASSTAAHVGSVFCNLDTTRKSLACGAMACAHSMSNASSVSHPEYTGGFAPGHVTVRSAAGMP